MYLRIGIAIATNNMVQYLSYMQNLLEGTQKVGYRCSQKVSHQKKIPEPGFESITLSLLVNCIDHQIKCQPRNHSQF